MPCTTDILYAQQLHTLQGFGQVACPACGGKGLTPEQRGER